MQKQTAAILNNVATPVMQQSLNPQDLQKIIEDTQRFTNALDKFGA